MNEIDWSLFGVNEHSTLKDLKIAFFNIALLTHPNKNQGVSKEEFAYVLVEYKKIKEFLEKKETNESILHLDTDVSLKKLNFETIQSEDDRVRDIPSFMSIYEEVHENHKFFNLAFENKIANEDESDIWRAYQSGGYAVEKSEYAQDFTYHTLKYIPENFKNDLENLKKEFPETVKEFPENVKEFPENLKKDIIDISNIQIGLHYAHLNKDGRLQVVDNFTTDKHIDYVDAYKQPCFLESTIPIQILEQFKLQEKQRVENIEYSCLLNKC